jgi:hypothetical protein
MDTMFWLATIGVAIIIVLVVLAAVSVDTERQRMMVRRVALQRRMLAEERRRSGQLPGRRPSRHQPAGVGWLDEYDD